MPGTDRNLQFLSASLSLCLFLSGCTHYAYRSADYVPRPLPQKIEAYYSYPVEAKKAEIKWVANHAHYREYRVSLPFTRTDFDPKLPSIEFEWYVAKSGPGPVVLVHPILGGDYPIEHSMCRFFAKNGFHVAMPRRKAGKLSPDEQLDAVEALLREHILSARQLIDWVERQPEVDPNRIYSFGISMGGITTVNLAAVEPRICKHVAALAGGDIPEILVASNDRALRRPREAYLRENNMTEAELQVQLRKHIRTDPLLLAPYVDPSKLTMLIAHFDRTLGKHSRKLWEALHRPETTFVPLGHYSSILVLPYLKLMSIRAYDADK